MKTFLAIRSRSVRIALVLLVPLVLGFWLFRVNLARRRAYVPLLNVAVAPSSPKNWRSIQAIAWSPDGKSLVGADAWSGHHVFEASTGKARQKKGNLPRDSLTWSRDGKMLAGTYLGVIEIINAATGVLARRIIPVHDANLPGLYRNESIKCYVSPDASLGAAMQWHDSITVWNLRTGKQTFRLKPSLRADGLRTEACGLAFSPDASRMAVARFVLNDEGRKSDPTSWMQRKLEIALYDLTKKRILRVMQWPWNPLYLDRRAELSLLFSPDGKTLAACEGHAVQLWDVKTGAAGPIIAVASTALSGGRQHLSFSPDGRFIARAGLKGEIEVWDVRSGQLLHTFYARSVVNDAKFSPNSKQLATSGDNQRDGFIKLWDVSFLQP